MKTKKFTILHSNDMHGDFLAESREGVDKSRLIGGLSVLSGYINQVRKEEKNVLYVISGDMLQGSMIDSEYKGISTMEIMNYLSPDVVALGNHEFDYGLPHLLFLEKMANFPIVNANLYIKMYNKRLMNPYKIITKDGFEILFTGIITEKVMDTIKGDKLVGSFVTLEEASAEVGKICNAYKNDDIDLTILLTHIGYESDVELAKMLDPKWGVDMIIGGHSHTILDRATKENNILIAQAGVGTDQIGRFDITVDDDTNSIVDYQWQLVPIVEGIAAPDKDLMRFIDSFKSEVDRKYSTLVCKFQSELTHPSRIVETELGDLFADAFAKISNSDVALVGSGSIRSKSMGPLVTLKDFLACFPYDDSLTKFWISGRVLKTIFAWIMRVENRQDEGECYQVNDKVKAKYIDSQKRLILLSVGEKEIDDELEYSLCLQGYHVSNCHSYLGVTLEQLTEARQATTISSSCQQAMEEYLRNHQNLVRKIEGRLEYVS